MGDDLAPNTNVPSAPGGSILSTRCAETYETKTALLSLFGIPLWYFSQSPRVVIQVSARSWLPRAGGLGRDHSRLGLSGDVFHSF